MGKQRTDITRQCQQGSEWVNREQIAHDSVSKVPNGCTENRYHTIVSARFRMGEQRTDITRQCQQGSEWVNREYITHDSISRVPNG